ncbi:MAG: DUF4249 family protein [Bacteroidota bacterium]
MAFCGLLLSSCETVIDVDLNDANPQYVIESNLNVEEGIVSAKVSKTASYFANDQVELLDNATVTLDVGGTVTTMNSIGNGTYQATNIFPTAGANVQLNVEHDGNTFDAAINPVPEKVRLDSLYSLAGEGPFSGGGNLVFVMFNDPGAVENFYRFRVWINDTLQGGGESLFTFDDETIDGTLAEFPLFSFVFDPGDTVTIEMISIDEGILSYYESMADIVVFQGGGSTAAPANPSTNVSNGALGYFNVYAADTMGIRIPE